MDIAKTLLIREAEVVPFQSEVFAPFKLVLTLENQVGELFADLVLRYVRDYSQQVDSREVFERKRVFLQMGRQKVVCEDVSLCFLSEFQEWEYCNVGCLQVLLLSEDDRLVLVSLNLIVQIFTDREYSGALKQIYSYLSNTEEKAPWNS